MGDAHTLQDVVQSGAERLNEAADISADLSDLFPGILVEDRGTRLTSYELESALNNLQIA